jgi:hypothetical protein
MSTPTVVFSILRDRVKTGRANDDLTRRLRLRSRVPVLPSHHDRTRQSSTATVSQVDYRELPERIKLDLTRPLTVDRTHSGVLSSPLLCFAKWLMSVYVTM